ncbi:hypothetical protein CPLU01_04183 [Colletotrichum plurivorum]|uniref:Uncharacterized protein n=1 Tax=Colletotrichum plurivorum TaxID=2175906 RepID=A0A8H6NK29_9PEZI|nr:hypothetical protein CPLU01_04183 [Colletotrichum plurivorum]
MVFLIQVTDRGRTLQRGGNHQRVLRRSLDEEVERSEFGASIGQEPEDDEDGMDQGRQKAVMEFANAAALGAEKWADAAVLLSAGLRAAMMWSTWVTIQGTSRGSMSVDGPETKAGAS